MTSQHKVSEEQRFQFFLAKLFGRHGFVESDGYRSEGYLWRGSLYVVAIKPIEQPEPPSS